MAKRKRHRCHECGKNVRRRHAPKPYCSNACIQAHTVERALTKNGPFDTMLTGHRTDFRPGQVIGLAGGKYRVLGVRHTIDAQYGMTTVLNMEPWP